MEKLLKFAVQQAFPQMRYIPQNTASRGGMVNFWSTLSGTYLGGLPYERQDAAVLDLVSHKLVNVAMKFTPYWRAVLY